MTSNEIRNVTFERIRKGYTPEDVDDFMQNMAQEFDRVVAEKTAAEEQLEDMRAKMYVLAEKAEEYRGQEDTLKTALINAQRMGETVVYEAKQKADQMLRDATGQSELLRQKAEHEINMEKETLERLRAEVTRFKATILNLYKQHIESLGALDPVVTRAEESLEELGPQSTPIEVPPEVEAPQILMDSEMVYEATSSADSEEEVTETITTEVGEEAAEDDKAVNLFGGVPVD